MTLKTRLLASTAVSVLLVFGLGQFWNYRQTSTFIEQHERQMSAESGHATSLGGLQRSKSALFTKLAGLYVFHSFLSVVALTLVLQLLWRRLFLLPLRDLLTRIRWMERGTWRAPIPVRRMDELGELTRAFNELGEQLTLSVRQSIAASKLAAMALLGQRILRRVDLNADDLKAALQTSMREGCSKKVGEQLRSVIAGLENISAQFDQEFQQELNEQVRQRTHAGDSLAPQTPACDLRGFPTGTGREATEC